MTNHQRGAVHDDDYQHRARPCKEGVPNERDRRLPVTARAALIMLVRQIAEVSAEIAARDTALRKENKASELGPRLETIPSVGPVIASALRARVTDATLFENGRHLSAWIGLVPENDSTGGKVKQNGLFKKGDRYLRSLLVNGAMSVVQQAQIRLDKHPWVTKLLGCMSAKQARSRSPTRPRGSPGPSWFTAASTRPAIAPPNIERRRARSPDERRDRRSGGARLQRQSERNTP